MKDLNRSYTEAKRRADQFMSNGELSGYFEMLVKMNEYKKLMITIIAN